MTMAKDADRHYRRGYRDSERVQREIFERRLSKMRGARSLATVHRQIDGYFKTGRWSAEMLRRDCPKCGQARLLEGPFYDRKRVTCLNCGTKFKIKPPKKRKKKGKR